MYTTLFWLRSQNRSEMEYEVELVGNDNSSVLE